MLLKLLLMLQSIKNKIANDSTVEVSSSEDGSYLIFKVKWEINDQLFTWKLSVGTTELSVTNIEDFEVYLEDRIVYLAQLAIEKSKRGD